MDLHTEQWARENTEVEHVLLSPFRFIANLAKGILAFLFCFTVFGCNASLWIVGCGSMGILDRQERAAKFATDSYETQSGIADFSVLFGSRDNNVPKKDAQEDHESPWLKSDFDQEGLPGYVPASGVLVAGLNANRDRVQAITFCSAKASDQDPGIGLDGWFDRSRSVFGRKASRMYEAYVTGAVGVTALRVTLTELKLGRDPLTDLSADPGQVNSLCHVDPFNVLTISESEYMRWVKTSNSIKLDAPIVDVRMVKDSWSIPLPPGAPDVSDNHFHSGWIISGMCMELQCQEEVNMGGNPSGQQSELSYTLHDDHNFYVTMYADLFYFTPPLSPHQTQTVEALNHLATEDYWIAEAHKNGVYNDAVVKTMMWRARYTISRTVAPDKVPDMSEGEDSINFIGGQY